MTLKALGLRVRDGHDWQENPDSKSETNEPSPADEARQIIQEYADDQRAIIERATPTARVLALWQRREFRENQS